MEATFWLAGPAWFANIDGGDVMVRLSLVRAGASSCSEAALPVVIVELHAPPLLLVAACLILHLHHNVAATLGSLLECPLILWSSYNLQLWLPSESQPLMRQLVVLQSSTIETIVIEDAEGIGLLRHQL